jgi:hypothetical protein
MKQEQVDRFRHWFEEYSGRFHGDDEYVNIHIRQKQEHTRRTCEEILFLAGQLALDDSQTWTAEVIALFHDIGRFPQFASYRTYNDMKSVDHCRLGVEVLEQEGVLDSLRREERQWIETAIEHHGRKSLPPELSGQALLLSKLIRDADKLDIFQVVTSNYRAYERDPGRFAFELEAPDELGCSPAVVEAVMNGRLVDYRDLRSLNDMKLCQIGWVHDLNFAASLERLRHRGHIEELFAFLPQNEEMANLKEKVLGDMDARLGRVPQAGPVSQT